MYDSNMEDEKGGGWLLMNCINGLIKSVLRKVDECSVNAMKQSKMEKLCLRSQ